MNRIIELIADSLGGSCLARPLNPAADGTVDCDVLELLPSAESGTLVTHCSDVPGAELWDIEIDEFGVPRELCRVHQLTRAEVAPAGTMDRASGWFYDTSDHVVAACASSYPPGQQISFQGHRPPLGSEVRLSCEQTVLGGPDGTPPPFTQLGTFCTPGDERAGTATPDNPCPAAPVPSGARAMFLTCDPVTRSCQVGCSTSAQCLEAGLVGSVCDTRPVHVVTGDPADGDAPYDICVNATCH